jgi:ribonuclease HI
VLVHPPSGTALERAGGEQDSTNNRMEMMAAIEALRRIRRPRATILVCTDSRYLIDCCSKWMQGWKRRGWTRKDGPLKNVDLLQVLDALIEQHDVLWQWVEGHSGVPGNERADMLANLAMDRIARGETEPYERSVKWTAPLPV